MPRRTTGFSQWIVVFSKHHEQLWIWCYSKLNVVLITNKFVISKAILLPQIGCYYTYQVKSVINMEFKNATHYYIILIYINILKLFLLQCMNSSLVVIIFFCSSNSHRSCYVIIIFIMSPTQGKPFFKCTFTYLAYMV